MSEAIARLAHDVGKHIARIARNLPETGPIPPMLARMLEADLYSLQGGKRASAIFDELAEGLDLQFLLVARERLTQIDLLESGVRAGDEGAQRQAAALALAVSDLLGSLLREDER